MIEKIDVRNENGKIKYYDENNVEITNKEELVAKTKRIQARNKKIVEMREIQNWFKKTDYIELQAIRGTIERESQKYQDYKNEYDLKLARYQELK